MSKSLSEDLPVENKDDIIVDYIMEVSGIMGTKKDIEQFEALEQFRIKYKLNASDIKALVQINELLDK